MSPELAASGYDPSFPGRCNARPATLSHTRLIPLSGILAEVVPDVLTEHVEAGAAAVCDIMPEKRREP